MTAKIIQWPYLTTAPIPPDKVLTAALEKDFESVFIVGFLKDGSEYLAASTSDGGTVMWLMERAKRMIHQAADDMVTP